MKDQDPHKTKELYRMNWDQFQLYHRVAQYSDGLTFYAHYSTSMHALCSYLLLVCSTLD